MQQQAYRNHLAKPYANIHPEVAHDYEILDSTLNDENLNAGASDRTTSELTLL